MSISSARFEDYIWRRAKRLAMVVAASLALLTAAWLAERWNLPRWIYEPTIPPLALWAFELAASIIIGRLTPIGGFHAAEHQVIATLSDDLPTLDRVRTASRTHDQCGTITYSLGLLLSLPAALLSEGADAYIRMRMLIIPAISILSLQKLRPALAFGHLWQRCISTREPSEQQLQLALICGQRLHELEHVSGTNADRRGQVSLRRVQGSGLSRNRGNYR